ncbi:hypothetical protein Zmor_003299 [Zophobas morio]|uniref:Uncharacterized protein n=1 Tax=Zophobas morio TaxID=2755281 RepID=A0AA38HML9_9CUCU|nr:hypothetical protein Zmor_003299 [Zophobas morio]
MGRLLLRCLTHPTLRHPLPGALRPRPYPPHATPLSLPVSRPRPPRPAHNHLSRPFQISPYYTHKALNARDMGTERIPTPPTFTFSASSNRPVQTWIRHAMEKN